MISYYPGIEPRQSLRVVEAPSIYPVTLDEAKSWCKVVLPDGDTREDAKLTNLIRAMTRHAENSLTRRAFCERTLELSCDWWPYEFCLPFPPLIEVLSVKYTDLDGAEQTVPPTDYYVDAASEPGRLRQRSGVVWPSVSIDNVYDRIRVRYRAGYVDPRSPLPGADDGYRDHIPDELRLWIQQRIVTLYNNRETAAFGFHTTQDLPRSYHDALLDSLVVGDRYF